MSFLAIVLWLGGIHFNVALCLVCLAHFPQPWAVTLLACWLALAFVPIRRDSPWGIRFAQFVCRHAPVHFPMKVHVEDATAFDADQNYVLAVEPHSILPVGLLGICSHAGHTPFKKTIALASSAIFYTPIVRHLWSWMGLAPATKSTFARLLRDGYTVSLVPGGVQECLYMKHGEEVVFLKQRLGFVKLAMQAGAPLVPCFCFGQTGTYRWWRPSGTWYNQLSRQIGFAPMAFWGMFGTPVPYPSPMYVVVGRPITVPRCEHPSREQVAEVHATFVTAMEQLFERHKVAAGFPDMHLRVF
eukprot:SM000061S19210  [mRNA]  locus=s61:94751:96513:- [translate_table: standard]